MPNTLVLVMRHGSTAFNDSGVYIGQMDVPLDDNGRKEAQETADFLKQFPIKVIVCSPLSRTMETAQLVGQALGVNPEPTDKLVPWAVGFMTKQPKAPLKEVRKFFIDNPEQPVPGNDQLPGESFKDFQDKFAVVLQKAIQYAETTGNMVLIVAHSNQITATENLVNGQSKSADQSYMVQPGGVVAVTSDDNGVYQANAIFRKADEAEQGTKVSGFVTNGKQYCGDCIHKSGEGQPYCIHPEVVKDPELQDRLVQLGEQPAIQIDLENDCCRFINKGEDTENPTIVS